MSIKNNFYPNQRIKFISIFLISALVVISRRPDAIVRPQFFAEDGFLWFAQAYNKGFILPFFEPVAGYFQTLARIGGLLSQYVPMVYAPLVMNTIALIVQILPILFIWTSRLDKILTHPYQKIFLTVSYLLLFNSQETHLNLTNAQWYLAILALLIIISKESSKKSWHFFDTSICLLSGLSGPFAILFYPVVILLHRQRNTTQTQVLSSIFSITASLQLVSVVMTGRTASSFIHVNSFLTSLNGIFTIFHKQVVWGLLSGQYGYEWFTQNIPYGHLLSLLISCAIMMLILYFLLKGKLELIILIIFASLIFLSGTVFPTIVVPSGMESWQVLENSYGIRYWLIPIFVLLIVLIQALQNIYPKYIQIVSIIFLSMMTIFWLKYYRYKVYYQFNPLENFEYPSQVKVFEKQSLGTEFIIHHPPRPWSMKLIKK